MSSAAHPGQDTLTALRDELRAVQAEAAALRASEAFLILSQRIASVGSWRWDLASSRVTWSQEMFRIFGVAPEDFDGTLEAAAAAFHPDSRARVQAAIQNALTGSENPTQEYRILRPDGSERIVWGHGEFQRDADGTPTHMIGTIHDITEHRRAERALAASEQRLGFALQAARLGLWEWDVASNQVVWSDEVYPIMGVEPGAFDGTFEGYVALLHPQDRAAAAERLGELLADPTADAFEVDHRLARPDGEPRWVRSTGRVSRDAAGAPLRMAGAVTDITERRRLEAELLESRQLETVGQLAGGVAHDFNNLLTAIRSSVELARRRGGPDCSAAAHLQTIQDASDRAARLVGQLLAVARRQVVALTVVDLNALIGDLYELLHGLAGERIQLDWQPRTGLWCVHADAGQLEQVLVNLTLNACEAMASGGVLTLSTANVVGPDGEHVRLRVSDTGAGMSEAVCRRVFEPFYTTRRTGTGLGLASSYGIVKQLGGDLTVQSAPGEGATFDVLLPRCESPAEVPPPPTPATAAPGTESILVVEDEALLRIPIVAYLEELGFAVHEAEHGLAALALADGQALDLVVSDVAMPQMGGVELARRLAGAQPGLPVLLMSGYGAESLERDGVDAGSLGFLRKPFTPAQLAQRIREILDGRQG